MAQETLGIPGLDSQKEKRILDLAGRKGWPIDLVKKAVHQCLSEPQSLNKSCATLDNNLNNNRVRSENRGVSDIRKTVSVRAARYESTRDAAIMPELPSYGNIQIRP